MILIFDNQISCTYILHKQVLIYARELEWWQELNYSICMDALLICALYELLYM